MLGARGLRPVPRFALALLAAGTLSCVGCGSSKQPDLGQVQGTVTMDGSPLANAQVIFSPDGGRPSTGVTDAAGKYTLTYIRDIKGAKLGAHSVRVETVPAVTSDQAVGIAPEGPPAVAERIPIKYNTESELRAEVKSGENTIDFSLNSK